MRYGLRNGSNPAQYADSLDDLARMALAIDGSNGLPTSYWAEDDDGTVDDLHEEEENELAALVRYYEEGG